jgi:sulfate adenylyltransferase subunit 2
MSELKDLENKSIYIIKEAYAVFEKPAVLWSVGRDSTTALCFAKRLSSARFPFG